MPQRCEIVWPFLSLLTQCKELASPGATEDVHRAGLSWRAKDRPLGRTDASSRGWLLGLLSSITSAVQVWFCDLRQALPTWFCGCYVTHLG